MYKFVHLILCTIAFTIWSTQVTAQDITIPADQDYKYDSPKTQYKSISYTAFNSSETDNYSFVFNTFSQPYKFFRGGIGNFGYAIAPLYLPDGAEIISMTGYYYDNTNTEFLRIKLGETPLGGSNTSKITIETTDVFNSSTVQNSTASPGSSLIIDNTLNSYYLRFESSDNDTSDIRLYAIVIEYEIENVD